MSHTINIQSQYIWLDGEIVPFADGKIPLMSPTLHYGVGVFAGMRCYETDRGPAVMRLEAHLEDFLGSIRALGFYPLPYDVTDLRRAIHHTITANGFSACYIRPIMYLHGSMGLDITDAEPGFAIATWQWDDYWGQDATKFGITMMVSSYTRSQTITSSFPSKMTGNYPSSVMAKTFARKAGFDEAIMLNPDGYIAECTGENLFMVKDGVIFTPTRTAHFGGITRDALMMLAADSKIEVREENLSREQLYLADEVFVCGTAAEVVAVREIDFRPIADGKMGQVTAKLQKLYHDTTTGKGKRSAAWLNYVGDHPLF